VASAVGFDASKKAEFETAKRGQNAKNRAKTIDADGDV
jgi:hypothetical protein